MAGADWRYRAFISYSQKDKVEARRLHRWLESYRPPRGVLAPPEGVRKLGRVFRDDEEMSAASDIATTVRSAIEDSQCLIVLCSPRSAQSKWVNAEITHFRNTGRRDKVFAVIVDGVPNSRDPDTECFPPALRADADSTSPEAMPIEPLGLDLRKEGRARACARLAAGLLGVDFDKLWQRERRRSRRQRLMFAGLAMGTVLSLAIGVGLFDRSAARDAFTAQATLLTQQGQRMMALPIALAGLGGERPDAERTVETLGGNYPLTAIIVSSDKPAEEVAFSPDSRALAVRTDGDQLTLWNAETGAALGAGVPSTDFAFSRDRVVVYRDLEGRILNTHDGALVSRLPAFVEPETGDTYKVAGQTLIAGLNNTDDQIGVWNVETGKLKLQFQVHNPTALQQLTLSKNGERLFICTGEFKCGLWNLNAGNALVQNVAIYRAWGSPALSDDGARLAARTLHGVSIWDGAGRQVGEVKLRGDVSAMALSPAGDRLAIASQGEAKLIDTSNGNTVADFAIDDAMIDTSGLGYIDVDVEASDVFTFSEDGARLLVKGIASTAELVDGRTGRPVLRIEKDQAAQTFFSPGGKVVIAQSFDQKATIWNADTGGKLAALPLPQSEYIEAVVFSDAGRLLALLTNSTTNNDPGSVSLWGYDGAMITDLGPRPTIPTVQISPDGHRLAAVLSDGGVIVWDLARAIPVTHGEALRTAVCSAALGGVPAFDNVARSEEALAPYLRGRPWGVCDWRGLDDASGWAQMVRYWAVRAGIPWDYTHTSCGGGTREWGCPLPPSPSRPTEAR